jgi:NADH:ubiquinone oxidoreductase subunit K
MLTLFIVAIVLLVATGLYCILATRNMIRVLIALEVVNKALTLMLVLAGVYTNQVALAQSFAITLIIIEVVVTAIGAGIAIAVYRRNGTLDMNMLTNIKG